MSSGRWATLMRNYPIRLPRKKVVKSENRPSHVPGAWTSSCAVSLVRGGGHEVAIRELTLFELSAKGGEVRASVKIPLLDEEVLKTILSLRGIE